MSYEDDKEVKIEEFSEEDTDLPLLDDPLQEDELVIEDEIVDADEIEEEFVGLDGSSTDY